MPLNTATLSGSRFSCASAIWIPVRIPKSPHPGHQSLCRSDLKSLTVSFLTGASTDIRHHHFRLRLGRAVEARAQRGDHLVLAERTTVELQHAVLDPDAGVLREDRAELTGVVLF